MKRISLTGLVALFLALTSIDTKVNCDDLDLGLNWAGSVYITSTQPLIAVVETLWPDKMSGYNGIPSQ